MDPVMPSDRADVLLLKPSRKMTFAIGFFGSLGLLFYAALESILIWLDFHPEFGLALFSWPFSLAFLSLFLYLIYLGIMARRGQGGFILSPEGFEVRSLHGKSPCKYRWADVTGFYVATVQPNSASNYLVEKVCFDKMNWTTSARRQILPFEHYPMTNHDIAALMNEWKEKYAPNPEGIVCSPVADSRQNSDFNWSVLLPYVFIIGLGIIIVFCNSLLGK